jgi:hypothetical protein
MRFNVDPLRLIQLSYGTTPTVDRRMTVLPLRTWTEFS